MNTCKSQYVKNKSLKIITYSLLDAYCVQGIIKFLCILQKPKSSITSCNRLYSYFHFINDDTAV